MYAAPVLLLALSLYCLPVLAQPAPPPSPFDLVAALQPPTPTGDAAAGTPSSAILTPWQYNGANIYFTGGNVGIGTSLPGHALAVNGQVKAHEVIVDITGWPDFVFDDDYRLRTLEEVARFIAAEGHLPDVPDAETVAREGLAVGTMQATLLQKIEELTRYLLSQHERLQRLEARQRRCTEAAPSPAPR